MPRKSGEAQAIERLRPADPHAIARPRAPRDLTKEQTDEWNLYVDRMPADWFGPETWALLSNLCRHICYAREVAGELEEVVQGLGDYERRLIEDNPEIEPKQLETLVELRMTKRGELARVYNMHTQSIAMLATKLRLTPQSKAHPEALSRAMKSIDAKTKPSMPWDDE